LAFTTSGQETDWVYSFISGASTRQETVEMAVEFQPKHLDTQSYSRNTTIIHED